MTAIVKAELHGFRELVQSQSVTWIAAAAVIVGDRGRAEEIVQDVLGRACQRWGEVVGLDRPGAWIRRAVINDAISSWRRTASERRALERLDASEPPRDSEASADPGHEVWAVVRDLPEQQCRAVALHYGADLAIADVAAELDLTVTATKTVLYRARRTLRERLDEQETRYG